MDDDKKPRDLAELRKLIDDKSRYTNVEDLETDLWEIINDRVKDLPPEDREEIVEHVKEELADNSETWLKEGVCPFHCARSECTSLTVTRIPRALSL